MESIERQITLAAPVDEVWAAVATAQGLVAWLGCVDVEVDARPDAPILVRWADGSTSRGLVEEAQEPERFAFRWRRLTQGVEGLHVGGLTRVTFHLTRVYGGTKVTITETPGLVSVGETVGTEVSS